MTEKKWKKNGTICLSLKRILFHLSESSKRITLSPESVVEDLFEKHKITELFDKIFVSHKYGLVKPQREFYKLCVNSFEKDFRKVYMIDDNKGNLIGLPEIGITPILFESAESVEKVLSVEF